MFVPSAVPGGAAASVLEVDELEEVEVEPEIETIDPQVIDVGALVSELEAHVRVARPDIDVPVARTEQITVPEAAAKTSEPLASTKRDSRRRGKRPRPDGPPPRPEPPAVSGEVSVSEPGVFEAPTSRREERVRAGAPMPRRDEPPAVSGEVAIEHGTAKGPEVATSDVRVMTMTSSGPQSVMTSSGSHPMMTSSGSHPIMTASGASPVLPRRTSTDPGYLSKDSTGPQPRRQSETTGPHPVMPRMRRRAGESSRDSLVLWVLAGALVVLALGVVMMVISWAQ